MPTSGPVPRGGLRLYHLVVAACCALAVLLFGSPPGRSADRPAPAGSAPAGQERMAAAAANAAPVDPDGVQRRRSDPAVALTFDDGPDPRWTPTVLALLP